MSDAATLAWKAAVEALGGSGSVSTQDEADIDAAIVALKSAGLWAKVDRLWLFPADNTQSARVDIKALDVALPGGSPGPTFTPNRGYTCTGATGYIDTTFAADTDAVNFTPHVEHFAIWNLTDGASASAAVAIGSTYWAIFPKYSDNNIYLRANDVSSGFAISDCRGFLLGNRSDDFTRQGYRNGVSVGTYGSTAAASLFGSETLQVFDRQIAAISVGGPLDSTEQLTYYNIIRNYMAAKGVESPQASANLAAAGNLLANATVKGGQSLSARFDAAASLLANSTVKGSSLSARLSAAASLTASATSGTGGLLEDGQAYTDLQRGMFLHWNFATYIGTEFVDSTAWPLDSFNPTGLDIAQWAQVAADFGCAYAVLTIKHLDGFCLWPTTTTTRGIANTTWYAANGNPDIVQQYVDAFRAVGVHPFYYFSIGDTDWNYHHPPGVTDATVKAAFKVYTEAQLTEVLTNYGQIGSIWLDSTYVWHGDATPWASAAERNAFIRSVSPGIIIIDNSHRESLAESDVLEYESEGPPGGNTDPAEACFSIGGPTRWFWKSDDQPNYDAGAIGNTITNVNGNNCTALVNVSPNDVGVIADQFVERLNETRIYLGEAPRASPNDMTANNVPSPYVASASSEYPGGYEAYRSFNSALDGFWSSVAGLPAWIQIDLGSARQVSSYMIQARKGGAYGQWLAWTLAGSPNGSSWTTVSTISQAAVVGGTVQFFDITPASYRYWRWTITSTTGTAADVGNLALIGPEVSAITAQSRLAPVGVLAVSATIKQSSSLNAVLSAAGALGVAARQVAQVRATFAATAGFGIPQPGATLAASGVLAAYASRFTEAGVPPKVQSVEERLYPEKDVHLVTHWNAQMELLASSGTLVGRISPGRGEAESIILDAPLKLEDDKLSIDIDALKALLGLP